MPLALLIAILGCGGSNSAHPQTAAAPDTRLGPGDTFEVAVYDEKELSGKYQVADDGSINFPMLGLIRVEGKGPIELAETIQNALKEKQILRAPSVSIFVTDYANKRITVVGAVAKPGSYPVTNGLTTLQAIGLAGGLTSLASANDTLITRRVDGKVVRYKVAVRGVSEGRAEDVVVQPGDTIYVPERIF